MFTRVFFALLLLSLVSAGSSLSCRWLDQKFKQHSEICLELLDTMVNNSTNTTEGVKMKASFPRDLYTQASKAPAAGRLVFIVQVLKEVAKLLRKDEHSSTSTHDNFLIVVSGQLHGLRPCIGSNSHKRRNNELSNYFHALSEQVSKMGHSAETWRMIRREIKTHLFRVDQLAASLKNTK